MSGNPLVRFREGSGDNLGCGRNIVAPPGNQAENRENKHRPNVRGVPDLLETPLPASLPTVAPYCSVLEDRAPDKP